MRSEAMDPSWSRLPGNWKMSPWVRAPTRLCSAAPARPRAGRPPPPSRTACGCGKNLARLGVLHLQGSQTVITASGATDADVFQAYVKQVPRLRLAPGNIVVLDNLLAHKAVGIQQALAWCRVRLRY
jgi:hypothetical protein